MMAEDPKPDCCIEVGSSDRCAHWEAVHHRKRPNEVSWFQREPRLSIELLCGLAVDRTTSVIDVGGGVSRLVDGLLAHDFHPVAVLDVSEAALQHARERLGSRASAVRWITGDVLEMNLGGPFDLWHDRAVFHFLTDRAERRRYAEQMRDALAPGGHAVMATFALDGPERCSGLSVVRYSADTLHQELGASAFELVDARREAHVTPQGREQRFQYAVLRKR